MDCSLNVYISSMTLDTMYHQSYYYRNCDWKLLIQIQVEEERDWNENVDKKIVNISDDFSYCLNVS